MNYPDGGLTSVTSRTIQVNLASILTIHHSKSTSG